MKRKTAESPSAENKKKAPRRVLKWSRLDNTAHLFPVIAGEHMTNVYRISVTLKEVVDGVLLQRALDALLPKFDGFNLRLRHGAFWHYFEENGKPAPKVQEEDAFPCRFIRPNTNRSYLFRVTYYKYRINLEVFHVLADGMGGLNFLRELTYEYLRLAHSEAGFSQRLHCGTSMNLEDSYLKHYRKSGKKQYKTRRAYLIKGEKLPAGEVGVMHGYMPLAQVKEVCRRYGVSVNEYLVAAYIWGVYGEHLCGQRTKDPIRVAVPVNLRPYFASNTTRNFFVMVSAEFNAEEENLSFEEVVRQVKESLRGQMEREHLEKIFSYNVSNQRNLFLRLVPLPLKKPVMRFVYVRSALANTATLTNLGKIEVAEAYRPYIQQFHAFLAISLGQHIRCTVCSYEETLTFTFTYDLADMAVQRGFFRRLSADGIGVEVESNGVNYG